MATKSFHNKRSALPAATILVLGLVTACGEAPVAAPPPARGEIRITEADAGPLLNPDGTLRVRGWSPREYLTFDQALATPPERLRRWDFFTVMNDAVAIDLTVSDIGFVSFASASVTEFATGKSAVGFAVKDQPADVFELSPNAHALTRFVDAAKPSRFVRFEPAPGGRHIAFDFTNGVSGDLLFAELDGYEYLALATPFVELPTEFFYEQKIPGMPVSGSVVAGGKTYTFSPADTRAIMDWGRGVWPDEVFWEWGQAAGSVDGVEIALNIGGGFGDMSAASENIVIYNGKANKLGAAVWTYDESRPTEPWHFASEDGRLNLTLEPFYASDGGLDIGSRYDKTLKAYGWMSGTLKLDSGLTISVRLLGFAERVRIKWG